MSETGGPNYKKRGLKLFQMSVHVWEKPCRRFSLGATPRELNEALTTSRSRRRDHWLNALGANFTESATI